MSPMDEPLVSFLLPNMNNGRVLELCLQRLADNTTYRNVELIAADDGSTDDSVEVLRRWRDSGRFGRFELLEREHGGIIETLNAALAQVRGELIVRIDGDATVETPGWLERMLAFHRSSDRIGVTVPKLVLDSGRIHSFGIDVVDPHGVHDRGTTPLEPPGSRTVDGGEERPLEAETTLGDHVAEVDAALGTWTMFSTELAHEIGGWDHGYKPVWFEDIDFSFAARGKGKKVFYLPDVRVIHRVGMRDSRIETSPVKRALTRANQRIGRFVPERVKLAAAGATGMGAHDPRKTALLESHHAHWREKWGFDPLNPDLDAVRERWSGTEICWRSDEDRRAAGEEILARWRQEVAA